VDLAILRHLALWALAPLLLAFLDAPFRTLRQRYRVNRWPERLVLFSIELNLLMLWAMTRVVLGRDVALLPEPTRLPAAAIGVALVWAGVAFAIWGKLTLGRWFTASFAIKEGHQLITHGPFAIVRHPIYTGLLALLLGATLVLDSVLTLGLGVLFVLPLWFHTAIEEPIMEQQFGDAWRDYAKRVPRLVPGWRAAPTATPRSPR